MTPARRVARVLVPPAAAGVALALVVATVFVAAGSPSRVGAEEPWFTVARLEAAEFTGAPHEPFFVAVVGNDAREGIGGARGDALHVVGIDPAARQATILDIPRDTVLDVPGHGRDKATHAYAYGGLDLTVAMLEGWIGVPISYAITTDFAGFVNMVDDIGGVEIVIREPMHDPMSGTHFDPGPMRLDGNQALAYNRDRYSFGSGDVQRTENQGYFLIATLATLRSQHPGAGETMRMLVSLVRNTEHRGMGLTEMYRLASLALSIDPDTIRNVVVPDAPAELFADFADNARLDHH